VTGNHTNVLQDGEILRRITIPVDALRQRVAHRRFSLTQLGRSTIFLIGTQRPGSTELRLTITAGTSHPIQLRFGSMPDAETLQHSIEAVPDSSWFDDPNGTPGHRRHLARYFAEEIRSELADGGLS
jgi:hypothetical protein